MLVLIASKYKIFRTKSNSHGYFEKLFAVNLEPKVLLWYILSKNSQFEECSIVPLDINGSLAGISDFGEDIVSEARSASGDISSHNGSKNDTDNDCNTEPSSFNRKKL